MLGRTDKRADGAQWAWCKREQCIALGNHHGHHGTGGPVPWCLYSFEAHKLQQQGTRSVTCPKASRVTAQPSTRTDAGL